MESPDAVAGAFVVRMRMTRESRPETFAATNGTGVAVLTNLSASMTWLYRPEWDLMRVTRRGPGIPAEWFVGEIRYDQFIMTIR